MSKPNREANVLRIMLALDAASHNPDAFATAISLARQLHAELIGLFVEDIDLLRSAQLPFSSEVIASSGKERALSGSDMERSLRAWTAQMQVLLQKEAEKANLKYSFRTIRGRRIETLLSEAGDANLVVFSRFRQQLITPLHKADAVCLLFDGSEESHHGVAILSEMAMHGLTKVILIDAVEGETTYTTRNAADWLIRHGIDVTIKRLAGTPDMELPALLKGTSSALFLLPASYVLCKNPAQLAALDHKLYCPIVVVK